MKERKKEWGKEGIEKESWREGNSNNVTKIIMMEITMTKFYLAPRHTLRGS